MTILDQMIAGQAPPLVPLTVDQYHQMIAQGIVREGDPIELIDGFLVRKDRGDRGGKSMHGPKHAGGVRLLDMTFRLVEHHGYELRSQLPVTIGEHQEPEPDLAIIRGAISDFLRRHPGPKDIAAAMEVSDTSLTFDRTTKQRLYATAGIPLYWIVNLADRQIEVYEKPQADGTYAVRTDYRPGKTVKLTLDPGLEIDVAVADILP